ncbi:uncharacterized protein LOC100381355 isoform 2 [Zea mays]|uniref:Uncharacterized protein n=1 Tax=Zea mays TaxID=4577 RepID=B6TQC8_MAIZE|nr:uncharacterized protein LOC100381355 isoform 2 [Zea mays]ACG39311.1 hypothetical protein [Zea mays]ONM58735.1 hypothetical protein ZEAMMB73_Zm00001d021822 [Zea mays]|eukprot:NP_001167688.1 uncharacterized protein LOC100381355 isoform 2 [Zea mays]
MSASTSLAKSSSEQSAFVELMAEDSGGWACSPRTRRSNHGRLRQACKLIHCYPFGVTEAIKLGHPSARGAATVGCGGFATLGANGHGLFFPGAWVAI